MRVKHLLLAFVVLQFGVAIAQGAASLDQFMKDVPTSTPQLMHAAYAKYASDAPALVSELAVKLKTPRDDEDTTARFAIRGLVWHVGKNGKAADKKALGSALLKAMPSANGPQPKEFLLEQLQYINDPSFADEIEKYLKDEYHGNQALRTLITAAPSDLVSRLIKALPTAPPRVQAGILQAVAKQKPNEGAEQIASWAENSDANIRAAALDALAAIGDPASKKLLQDAAKKTEGFQGGLAPQRYLNYAERLNQKGKKAEAIEICREFIDAEDTTLTAHNKISALASLINIEDVKALPDLMKAADSDLEEIHVAALRMAAKLKGSDVTRTLIDKMKKAPAPEIAADAALALGERGDKSALPALLEMLKSEDVSVRVAAVKAAGRLDRSAALPAMIDALSAKEKDLLAAVSEQLARAANPDLSALLVKGFKTASAPGKVVLIEAFATRRFTTNKEMVFDLTKASEPSVRSAAYKTLRTLGDSKDLPRLLDMMLSAEDANDQTAARSAFVGAARQDSDGNAAGAMLLKRYNAAAVKDKAALVEAMGALSASGTLDTVIADAKTSATPELQDAAVRALSDWQTTAALPALMPIVAGPSEEKHQIMALRGLIRLADLIKEPTREKLNLLETALKAAKRPDEIRLALAQLPDVQTLPALKLVDPYLSNDDVKADAAIAAMKIALPGKKKKGVTGAEAASILTRALPGLADAKQRKQLEAHINQIELSIAKKDLPRDADGFASLFNGKDLSGWVGATKGYRSENDVLVCLKEAGGKLMTEKEFSDFTVRFEFKLEPGANNGLGIRAPLEGDAAYEGMEIQILDDDDPQYKDIHPWQVHGSIYGVHPAEKSSLKPDGEWNSEEVTAQGNHIKVVVNGKTVVDTDITEAITSGTVDGKHHPGLKRNSGHIGFLGHGHRVEFRNIRIKELSSDAPEGFTALFNGKDLSGWKGLVGNPNTRAKMSPEELKAAQAEADNQMNDHWSIQDGMLIFDGKGASLCTTKDYKNFEMLADWKIGPGGDSGLYLRGSPQVQIWDLAKDPMGSGGLYNNQKETSVPLVVADNPIGQWNQFRVKMEGDKVTVDLNGKRVVENETLENYWDRNQPIFPTGQIELQAHESPVCWRNLFIRELP